MMRSRPREKPSPPEACSRPSSDVIPQLGLDERPPRVEHDVLVVIGERHASPRQQAPEVDGATADGNLQHAGDPLAGPRGGGREETHVDGAVQPLTRDLVETEGGHAEVQRSARTCRVPARR